MFYKDDGLTIKVSIKQVLVRCFSAQIMGLVGVQGDTLYYFARNILRVPIRITFYSTKYTSHIIVLITQASGSELITRTFNYTNNMNVRLRRQYTDVRVSKYTGKIM